MAEPCGHTSAPVTGRGIPGTLARWRWLGLTAFGLVTIGPLFGLAVEFARDAVLAPVDLLALAVPLGRRGFLLLHSVVLSMAVAAGAMSVGLLAATLLWSWRTGVIGRLRWLVVVPLLIPPYIHALAWSPLLSAFGAELRDPAGPSPAFQSWLAVWWVQLMAFAPLAVMLAMVGVEAVEMRLVEVGQLLADDLTTYRVIVAPLAAPAIMAGAALVFVLCVLDYSVPSLFGVGSYALELFAEYSASGRLSAAVSLGLPLATVAFVVVSLGQAGLRAAAVARRGPRQSCFRPLSLPAWLVAMQWVAASLLVAALVVPLVSLVLAVASWEAFIGALVDARAELSVTGLVSVSVGVLALPLGLVTASQLPRSGRPGVWWMLVILPLAVPPSLVGIGMIALWNHAIFDPVYGGISMLVLAGLARFAPIAAFVLLAQLRRIDPLQLDAARLLQSSDRQTLVEILLPLLTPGLVAAFSITAILASGELGATLLVAPPGQATLTMRVYNYLHYGASGAVAGLCLALAVAGLLAGLLAIWAFSRNRGWSS